MDKRRYLVDAVVVEGRGICEVAREHGVSKGWVSILVSRYRAGGYEAISPQSRCPRSSPKRLSDDIENAIITIRKHLAESGFDAGPHTIHFHLAKQVTPTPSVSTIWRVLKRRGLRRPRTEEAAEELIHPFRGRPAERVLAGRRHPLDPEERPGRRDPRLHRRSLPGHRRGPTFVRSPRPPMW